MPIEFHCKSCAKLLRVPDNSQGKTCQCPACGDMLDIPLAASDSSFNDAASQNLKLKIPCPKCRHQLLCEPSLLGTKGQCRNCNHVFTINQSGGTDVAPLPTDTWVFSCPKCNQLFDGNASMEGRRGKCHACGEVFSIALRKSAEQDKSAASQPAAPKLAPLGRMVKSQPVRQGPDAWESARLKQQHTATTQSRASQDFESALGDMSLPNPYALAPNPTPYSRYATPPTSSHTKYTVCGIFLIFCAGLTVLFAMYMTIVGVLSPDQEVRGVDPNDAAYQAGRIFGILIVTMIPLVLALLELLGGIALIRRRGLLLARIGAIAACVPCVCLILNIPFGIWACVLAFGASAPRDFHHPR